MSEEASRYLWWRGVMMELNKIVAKDEPPYTLNSHDDFYKMGWTPYDAARHILLNNDYVFDEEGKAHKESKWTDADHEADARARDKYGDLFDDRI